MFKRKKDMSFTERFETDPGVQAQFDMKEKVKLIDKNNNVTIINIPTLTLSWSRYNVRKLILDTKTDNLLSFLASSFEHIGGVPEELVIDNLKQFVEKPRYKDKEAILTNKLIEFAKDYNIKIKPCMPYRPQTKGKTEHKIKLLINLKIITGNIMIFMKCMVN